MKPIVKETTLDTSGIQNSVNFGIKDSGLAHVFGILRNQLYSDKILAVIREYSCNAVDAHVQAGCGERPIEVTLPTKLKREFKVRDFGPALSSQEIKDVYAFYGESTKRETNNQIGMLGIGSKSAFAYGDNFIINSYLNGKKHIWNAFIDPSQIGQISKIGEEDTNEENGIEIVISVREEDVIEFLDKARSLFRYFKVKPLIRGAKAFEYSDREKLFDGEDWSWSRTENYRYGRSYECVVVMGNIGYSVSGSDLNFSDEQRDKALDSLVQNNLELSFDIGDLEISASREKLQLTDSTRQAIIDKLEKVKSELIAKVSEQFKSCGSLWDAKCMLADIRDLSSGLYNLRGVIEKNLKWNGEQLDSSLIYIKNIDGINLVKVQRPQSRNAIRYKLDDDWSRIEAGKNVVVVYNDLKTRRGIMGRLLALAMEEKKDVWVIELENAKARKYWKEVFDGKMLKLSSLDKRPLSDFYGATSGTVSHDASHAKKINSPAFEFDFKGDHGWGSKKSDWWKPADVDMNKKGVYVIIDRFMISDVGNGDALSYGSNEPSRIAQIKIRCEKAGIKFPKRIFAWKVAKASVPEKSKNFITLADYLKKVLREKIRKDNLEQKWVDRLHAQTNHVQWHDLDYEAEMIDKLISKDSPMKINLEQRQRMLHADDKDTLDEVRELAEYMGLELNFSLEPSFNLAKSNKEVKQKYEMFEAIDWYCFRRHYGSKADIDIVINYVNVIDVCDASR